MNGLVDLGLAELREKRSAAEVALKYSETEQQKLSRELFFGGLPSDLSISGVIAAMNGLLRAAQCVIGPGDPIVRGYLGHNNSCILSFRSVEECQMGMRLNGCGFRGGTLRVGKPRGFLPLQGPVHASLADGSLTDSTADERLCLVGIDPSLSESLVQKEVARFGHLEFFSLISPSLYLVQFEQPRNLRAFVQAIPNLAILGTPAVLRFHEAVSFGFTNFGRGEISRSTGGRALFLTNAEGISGLMGAKGEDPLDSIVAEVSRISPNQLLTGKVIWQHEEFFLVLLNFRTVAGAATAKRRLDGQRFRGRRLSAELTDEKFLVHSSEVHLFPDPSKQFQLPISTEPLTDPLSAIDQEIFEWAPLPPIHSGKVGRTPKVKDDHKDGEIID